MGRDLVPLTPEGIQQVEWLAECFPYAVDLLLSSPMTRALQTAATLGARWAIAPRVEFDLHEWTPDTTFSYDSSRKAHEAYIAFRRNRGKWPQGRTCAWEQSKSVAERLQRVLGRYAELPGTIAVVCHGVVIEVLTGRTIEPAQWTEYRSAVAGGHTTVVKE